MVENRKFYMIQRLILIIESKLSVFDLQHDYHVDYTKNPIKKNLLLSRPQSFNTLKINKSFKIVNKLDKEGHKSDESINYLNKHVNNFLSSSNNLQGKAINHPIHRENSRVGFPRQKSLGKPSFSNFDEDVHITKNISFSSKSISIRETNKIICNSRIQTSKNTNQLKRNPSAGVMIKTSIKKKKEKIKNFLISKELVQGNNYKNLKDSKSYNNQFVFSPQIDFNTINHISKDLKDSESSKILINQIDRKNVRNEEKNSELLNSMTSKITMPQFNQSTINLNSNRKFRKSSAHHYDSISQIIPFSKSNSIVSLKGYDNFSTRRFIDQKFPIAIKILKEKEMKMKAKRDKNNEKDSIFFNLMSIKDFSNKTLINSGN